MAYVPNGTNGPNGGRINVTISGNTQGVAALISTGTMVLTGGNNMTLAQGGSNVTISAGHIGGSRTLSRWEFPVDVFASLGTVPHGSLSIQKINIPHRVAAASAKIGGSISVNPSGGVTTTGRTMNLSVNIGVYSLNGSTLQRITSGSANNVLSWTTPGIGGGENYNSANGMRQLTAPLNATLTPGVYWVAANVLTAGFGATISLYGNNDIAAQAGSAVLTPLGINTTVSSAVRDVILFQGVYSATTAGLPATIEGSQINNTGASNVMRAHFYHALYNATY